MAKTEYELPEIGSVVFSRCNIPLQVISTDGDECLVSDELGNTAIFHKHFVKCRLIWWGADLLLRPPVDGVKNNRQMRNCVVGVGFKTILWGWAFVQEIFDDDCLVIFEDTGNTAAVNKQKLIRGEAVDEKSDVTRLRAYNSKPTPKGYYVYKASFAEITLYIGYGSKDRYMHCNSGTSSSYELNRMHFDGKKFLVEIIEEGLSKDDARKLEAKLITELDPVCNIHKPRT